MSDKIPDLEKDATFFKCLDVIEKFEGGYADDPEDSGGATLWGVTQHAYDAFRQRNGSPLQPVRMMSDEECTAIYYNDYWLNAACDVLSYPFALCHFDAVVNMAPYWWKQCRAAAAGNVGAYLDKRDACYRQIVKAHPQNLKFLAGWEGRVARLRLIASA